VSDPIRIGVLGLSHDHVWENLHTLVARDDAELVAAADLDEELRTKFAAEFNQPVLNDPYELLDTTEIDAVYVFSSNHEGSQYAAEAAASDRHVLIEKPMASSLHEADAVLAEARRHDVRLMVNWPFAWWPQLQHALRLAADGTLGDIWQVKYRAAHAGPEELGCSPQFCEWLFDESLNGGGALMDYCCYGACLARAIMGMPSRVTGITGRFCKENIEVDDNALIAMTYPRGMATAEGSWTQIGKLTAYTTAIYGTQGTLQLEPRAGGRLLLATEDQPDGQVVDIPSPAAHLTDSAAHFLHGIRTGEPFLSLCQDRVCRDVQEILEAGQISVASGSEVSLPLPI
jgi:predicted dehydrogenase